MIERPLTVLRTKKLFSYILLREAKKNDLGVAANSIKRSHRVKFFFYLFRVNRFEFLSNWARVLVAFWPFGAAD